jgi:mannose-6-phosphate isomerase-like protein (cupin superfamily)
MIDVKYEKDPKIKVPKAWGEEIIIHNDDGYCGKLLRFRKGGKFSMHFHSKKTESWYVNYGKFVLTIISTKDADRIVTNLVNGDIVHVEQNTPHQLEALEEGEIFEVSTPHMDEDSYRIEKGDSQK